MTVYSDYIESTDRTAYGTKWSIKLGEKRKVDEIKVDMKTPELSRQPF